MNPAISFICFALAGILLLIAGIKGKRWRWYIAFFLLIIIIALTVIAYSKTSEHLKTYQIAEDLVYAAVRGKIEKVNIVKEGWDDKDRNLYKVKLKAYVKPVYPEKGEGISLKVSLSKTILKEGEEVKIFFQASRDCYIYIFSVAADGSVTLLLPNSINRDNLIKSGTAYEFPTSESKIKLKAMFLPDFKGKSAEERIKIIATKNKEEIVPLGFQEGMFKVHDSNSTGMISDLVKKLNQLEPAEWTEATVGYRIER